MNCHDVFFAFYRHHFVFHKPLSYSKVTVTFCYLIAKVNNLFLILPYQIKINYNMSLTDDLQWRYATKKMNGQTVPEEKLDYILEAARLAPSSSGLQPY